MTTWSTGLAKPVECKLGADVHLDCLLGTACLQIKPTEHEVGLKYRGKQEERETILRTFFEALNPIMKTSSSLTTQLSKPINALSLATCHFLKESLLIHCA